MPPKRMKRAKPVPESDDDGSDFSAAPRPPKRAKRGKGATGKGAAAKSKKEPVRKSLPKHGLHKLPEMPLDIVFEILSYLDPVDLVHLMKVSKAFNTFLASEGAEPFWAAARRVWTFDEDELPPKPDDMTYYELIDFLFGRYCHRCLKGTTLQTCYEVRARYCPPCRKSLKRAGPREECGWSHVELKNWVGKIPLNKSIAETNIYSLMPVLSDKPYLQENLVLRAHYPVRHEDLTQFLDQLRNVKPKDQPKFLMERQEYIVRRRRDEPRAYYDFYTRQLQNRADTVKSKKEQRFNSIMDKLEELDWAEEVQLMSSHTLDSFKALPCVNQTKPMTDRMFKNAQPALVEFLENTKAARLLRERKAVFEQRLSLFSAMLPTLQAWRPGLPTPYEYATGLAACRAIMEQPNEVTVTRADFRALKDNGDLDAFTEAQNTRSRAFFANNVRKSLQGVVIPETTDPLNLAVGALFQCNTYGCATNGGWEHMRAHWCERRGHFRTWDIDDVYGETAAKICGARGWNEHEWYTFARSIKHVVELAGLDPATATPDDMDKSPMRFACSSCDERRHHVEVFGWLTAAQHESHISKVYALTPSAAECARSLETKAIAKVAKSYAEWDALGYYCAKCRKYYSRRERMKREAVIEHLRSKSWHNIAEPQEGEHYCHVPWYDEWAFKRGWSVYLLPMKQTSGEKSYVTESDGALYFDFEEDKPAPEGFKPPKQ